MFNSILVCSFVPKNNETSINAAFEMAKKFDSNIILLKCFHKSLPAFALFHTKSEKRKQNKMTKETQLALEEVKEMAKSHNISIKTESVFVESLSDYVSSYIQKNHIDLLIADSVPPTDIAVNDHKDIVNRIYKNIDCPILTLK